MVYKNEYVIKNNKSFVLIKVNRNTIDDFLFNEIVSKLSDKKVIGIDMQNVECIESCLLNKYLHEDKIRLYNVQNDILSYLSTVSKKSRLNIYQNEEDFINEKREFIRRRFKVA